MISSCQDELCHHSYPTWHKTSKPCTCSHSNSGQAYCSLCSSQACQIHRWLDLRNFQIGSWELVVPWLVHNPTLSWCSSHHTHPQEMPHLFTSKGQRASWQNGTPVSDHPCGPVHRLGVINHLHPESKWQATSVFRSPWTQWGHLLWSPQDTHCGGSCPWISPLLLLDKAGYPSWILINCSSSGMQPTHNLQ